MLFGKARHLPGFFMFRMNGIPRAQGSAGAVPLSFARCLTQDAQERPVSDLHSLQLDSVYVETVAINLLSGVVGRQSLNHFIVITCAHFVHH